MKIKEQTRKLAAGCSKHGFEVVDRTDEVSSKHCFEVVNRTDEVSNHTYGKAKLTWFEEIFEEYDLQKRLSKLAKNPPKARTFSTPSGRKDVTPEQPTAITSKKKHKNRNAGKQRSR